MFTIPDCFREEIKQLLLSGLDIKSDNSCWLWTKGGTKAGYGQIRFNYRIRYTHVISYKLFVKDFEEDLCVLHKCDVRACCNPQHLFLGTKAMNTEDMIAKGRMIIGENCTNAKLSNNDAIQIINKFKTGQYTQLALAQEFKVNQSQISRLVRRERWRHIQEVLPSGV